MADFIDRINTFFLEEKERFIKEFSFLFNADKDLSCNIGSDNTEYIINFISEFTDVKNLSDIEEYLKSDCNNLYKVVKKCCELNSIKAIESLLKIMPTSIDSYLENSAKSGNLIIVKYLVENGAKINNSNAIVNAAIISNFEIVQYLVENGADPNNDSVLRVVATKGDLKIMQYLVERGANVNSNLVLYNAVFSDHLEIVKYLVHCGANVNEHNALKLCVNTDRLEITKFLISYGANFESVITNVDNKVNRFLYMRSTPEKENLFNPQIVSDLKAIKLLID